MNISSPSKASKQNHLVQSSTEPTMDSTPPSHRSETHLRTKSSFRHSKMGNFRDGTDESSQPRRLHLSSAPPLNRTQSPPYLSLRTPNSVRLQELLILSHSPLGRSKTHNIEMTEMVDEAVDSVGYRRRRCKSRSSPLGLLGCSSPRNSRRSRRRYEQEFRDDKDMGLLEENAKQSRRRKPSNRTHKEKLMSLVPSVPYSSSSTPTPRIENDEQRSLNRLGHQIYELIMWKEVAKSSLWFGFGCLYFLSSCFTGGLRCSIFSSISQLSLLFLALSFFYNSFSQRKNDHQQSKYMPRLREDDILRLARVVLPAVNLVTEKTRVIFSGEPSMTLKVAPLLLFGAEHGHLITLWRLCAVGFFISFSVPKLYTSYNEQINRQVQYLRVRVSEAWGACTHKKIVAVSVATAFWNLSSIKTRLFTAFISVVILRYHRQQAETNAQDEKAQSEESQQKALVVLYAGSQKEQF